MNYIYIFFLYEIFFCINNLKKNGKNCFYYSAKLEQLFYGTFANDIFIEGFVGKFNDNGELEKMIKYKNKKIIENEINDKDTVKKMLTFRNIIMSKDYFGMLYDIFKDAIEFKNQNMNDVEIFNSELYIDLMDIAASYNQISIFKDIEKHLKE